MSKVLRFTYKNWKGWLTASRYTFSKTSFPTVAEFSSRNAWSYRKGFLAEEEQGGGLGSDDGVQDVFGAMDATDGGDASVPAPGIQLIHEPT